MSADADLLDTRAAHPDDLVFRANTWQPGALAGAPPDSTALVVVPPGKRADRAPFYSSILGMCAVFGIDEVDFNRPAALSAGITATNRGTQNGNATPGDLQGR